MDGCMLIGVIFKVRPNHLRSPMSACALVYTYHCMLVESKDKEVSSSAVTVPGYPLHRALELCAKRRNLTETVTGASDDRMHVLPVVALPFLLLASFLFYLFLYLDTTLVPFLD